MISALETLLDCLLLPLGLCLILVDLIDKHLSAWRAREATST